MSDKNPSRDATVKPGRRSALAEFGHFVLHNKKWWLAPIAVILLLMGLLVVFGGSGVAPFIYSVF